ncbi:MAG: hypothetical protein QOF44_4284, partial [Streptomyces sp.]|nr:hypothetical protein [Streptomyces sp.]
MSSPESSVRPERSSSRAASGPVVAVTGAASGVGRLLALRLVESDQVKKVVAIDERRG